MQSAAPSIGSSDVLITAHRERPWATLQSILCKSSSESTSFTRSEKGVRRTCRVYPATHSFSLSLSLSLSFSLFVAPRFHHLCPPDSPFLCVMFLRRPFPGFACTRGQINVDGAPRVPFFCQAVLVSFSRPALFVLIYRPVRVTFSPDSQCIILIDYSLRR